MGKWPVRLLIVIIALGIPFANLVHAADFTYAENAAGKWDFSFPYLKTDVKSCGMSATESAAYQKKLQILADILHAAPPFNQPRGVNITATASTIPDPGLGEFQDWKKPPIVSTLTVCLYNLITKGGKTTAITSGNHQLHITFNNPYAVYGAYLTNYNGAPGLDGGLIFFQPQIVKECPGYTLYDNGLIVIGRTSVTLFKPITAGYYQCSLIRNCQMAIKNGEQGWDNVLKMYKEQYEAMTPEQRDGPAYINGMPPPQEVLDQYRDSGQPIPNVFHPLAIINPAYFDRSLPRTAVQLIVLDFGGGFDRSLPTQKWGDDDTASLKRMAEAFFSIDYKKIAGLIDLK